MSKIIPTYTSYKEIARSVVGQWRARTKGLGVAQRFAKNVIAKFRACDGDNIGYQVRMAGHGPRRRAGLAGRPAPV